MNHADHAMNGVSMEAVFRRRFFLVLLLTLPVVGLSPTIQQWFGFTFHLPYGEWILLTLSSVIVLYGGWPFYVHARYEIASRQYGMMTLVSLAVLSGYAFSVASTFITALAVDFYWEISTLVLALLLGHWMEMRAVRSSSGALEELVRLIPDTAHMVAANGETFDVATAEVAPGSRILVRAGEKVPVDARIVSGEAGMDESMITGESRPVFRRPGDTVIGGTIATDGSLVVETLRVGADTALARIIEMVRHAQASRPAVQRLADTAAKWLTFTAIGVGVSTFLIWTLFTGQGIVFALTLSITVVVIACPHALGLAIPTVTSIVSGVAARHGILLKDVGVLERAMTLTHVVFDKTGTLTTGAFTVREIRAFGDTRVSDVLRLAASVDAHSSHVIARGIVDLARQKGLSFSAVSHFVAYPGMGGEGTVQERQVLVGNERLMERFSLHPSPHATVADEFSGKGYSIAWVAYNGEMIGMIGLSDSVREGSRDAVKALKEMGITPVLLTGDKVNAAQAVAAELGIEAVFAEVLPEHKTETIRDLQEKGGTVAMVGDGVNDAPSLAQADIGIAIGAGTDVAAGSAEVILVKNDPRDVLAFLRIARRTTRKMKQNLIWAAGYNVVAIPVAAGILYPIGIVLRPEWGALLMSASSVIVVANAFLLKLETAD